MARQRTILGIDPGLRRTGFGVVVDDGGRLRYVASGIVRTELRASGPADADGSDLARRLGTIFRGLTAVIEGHRPDEAVIERVFVNVNPASTLLLGQARGAAIAALVAAGLPVHEYGATQVKQAVVGRGHATKAQMQAMVSRLLGLPGEPSADAADALGCALAHLQLARVAQALAPRLAPRRGGALRLRAGRLA